MHEREKIYKRLCKFFIEIFEFTDEQLAAIDYQIPMTQEIYDSVDYSGRSAHAPKRIQRMEIAV